MTYSYSYTVVKKSMYDISILCIRTSFEPDSYIKCFPVCS